jgi:hypothetical protein
MTEKSPFKGLPQEAQKIVPIREIYDGPLLPFSYTLKLDATIIDRTSKLELKTKIGDKKLIFIDKEYPFEVNSIENITGWYKR